MVNFSLEGKVALVTGGVYGIGFAIAKALHEAGAKIVYNCSTQKSMDLGVANYREAGIDAKGYLCDVTDEAAVKAMVADKVPYILGLGIKMGAVMELIPRVTVLFIEGLKPISEATRHLIARRFGNAAGLNIGMSPALVIGHPTTLVVSLLLIPVTLALAVLLPGNKFLPLASLAGMFYVFPLVLPFTRGNVVKTFIIGLVVLTLGLYMVTNLAPAFTLAANDVHKATGDGAVAIPEGFARGGSLDFASSPLAWVIYQAVHNLKWIGSGLLVLATMALMWWNRVLILRSQNNQKPENI